MHSPIGKVTVATPGTPVSVLTFLGANLPAGFGTGKGNVIHGIMFEVLPTNTGLIYIGQSNMDKSAMSGIYAWLGVPTENFSPTHSAALTISPNGLNLGSYYIDADDATDGVIVSVLVT